ncbi:MAG TPA: HEAT repeat domain-containing protein [Acidobacteriota bacterium]|nr:HEAT repeat domain-containing protein [Acidobacteriota bacterium]
MQKVIWQRLLALILLTGLLCPEAPAAGELERRIDSLFIIASSGEVRFRDQNEPAMDSVAALGAAAVPHLIEKFTTKSARERWTVIWILQRIGSAAVPDLVRALDREDGLVVQRICWALGDIKDTAAVRPIMRVCTHERWQVRDQAVGALGKIGDAEGGPAVLQALADSIGQVRKSAAVACGQLGLGASVMQLAHVLGDDFYGARMSAAHSLLTMDTAVTVRALSDSMSSENHLLGNLACRVLGQLGTDEALEILLEQAVSGDSERRAHAATALIAADPLDNCGFRRYLLENETDRLVVLKIQSAIQAVGDGQ